MKYSCSLLLWVYLACLALANKDTTTTTTTTTHQEVVSAPTVPIDDTTSSLCEEGSSSPANQTESTPKQNQQEKLTAPNAKINKDNDDNDDAAAATTIVKDDNPYNHKAVEVEESFFDEEYNDEWEHKEQEEEEEEPELYYRVWDRTKFTLDEFTVAGVNLANYGNKPLFQLYHDFDISMYIRGDEDWPDLLAYRNGLERPSLSFYVDKVARKRWIPVLGLPQPAVKWMAYGEELSALGQLSEEIQAVQQALPTTGSFCAKPTHMSLTKGAWLVDHQPDGSTHFSLKGLALQDHGGRYNPRIIAQKLADSLHEGPEEIESWALKNVKPGLVVEERWASHEDPTTPPHEFNMFTIWGRVWVGQWNTVEKENRWCDGFFYRNGTSAHGSYYEEGKALPDWVPWKKLINIAERLGAHKDMFRTDIFVGRPVGDDAKAPLRVAVSESEIFPTTEFTAPELSREGARLWIAGYQLGIYEIVENTEVPSEFLHSGKLSEYSDKE